MAIGPDGRTMTYTDARAARHDEGLRKYMLGIYNHMASGLLISGLIAYLITTNDTAMSLFFSFDRGRVGLTGLGMAAAFAPLGLLLLMSFGGRRMSSGTLGVLYYAFTVLQGVSLAVVLLRYTGESVALTFVVTASAFAGLSLYGYTTRRSLSALGSFAIMGLIGLFIAMIVNIFLDSTMMQFIIAVGGVLIFSALTAYDTQNLKRMYLEGAMDRETERKSSIFGALHLYINFINLFQFLLMFLGERE